MEIVEIAKKNHTQLVMSNRSTEHLVIRRFRCKMSIWVQRKMGKGLRIETESNSRSCNVLWRPAGHKTEG